MGILNLQPKVEEHEKRKAVLEKTIEYMRTQFLKLSKEDPDLNTANNNIKILLEQDIERYLKIKNTFTHAAPAVMLSVRITKHQEELERTFFVDVVLDMPILDKEYFGGNVNYNRESLNFEIKFHQLL